MSRKRGPTRRRQPVSAPTPVQPLAHLRCMAAVQAGVAITPLCCAQCFDLVFGSAA